MLVLFLKIASNFFSKNLNKDVCTYHVKFERSK